MSNSTDFPIYTVAQMRQAEQQAETDYGISLTTLMSRAGRGLAREAMDMLGWSDGPVWIFCGNGNNGGDGYVCGADLIRNNIKVVVCAVDPGKLHYASLAGAAAQGYRDAGGVIVEAGPDMDGEQVRGALVVDCLLGTGLSRDVTGLYARLIEIINASGLPVLACDVPSGVDADTGAIMGTAVAATRTVMMGLGKPGCALEPGSTLFGELAVCDIGLSRELIAGLGPPWSPGPAYSLYE